MTTLKGAKGISVTTFDAQKQKLTAEFEKGDKAFKALDAERRQQAHEPGAKPKASQAEVVLGKEIGKPGPIDWTRFEALRRASPTELQEAVQRFRAIDRLDLDFQKLAGSLRFLGTDLEIEKLPDLDARVHYQERRTLLGLIDAVRAGVKAAGECPATADFPHEQLKLLEQHVLDDMQSLLDVKGKSVTEPPPRMGGPARSSGYAPGTEPSHELLPPTKAVLAAQVKTVEEAAQIIGARLGSPGLADGLIAASKKLGVAERAEFARYLGAYAILADEAVHAPDYKKDPMGWGPEHRQEYRSRKQSGWENEKSGMRREISRASLQTPLIETQGAANPLAALEKGLVKEFLREIGVPEQAQYGWAAKPEAVAAALEGEAFLPLRALNERAPYHIGKEHSYEMQQLVRSLTRSVVEGRFEDWRLSHPTSQEQMALLTDAQRKVWLEGVSVKHEVKGKDGKPITFTTASPRGFEMFWATKVGGPSHGFDTMTQCLVPLLTNARNDTIVVNDPRWPNQAGRTYLRLVQLAKSGEPVLFLESSHRDFPYPGSKLETETAIIKHAIATAKAMDIRLVLSGRNDQTIHAMGLQGQWKEEKYRLLPSLLNEAASVFGPHDWVQKETEVRGASSTQFFVDLEHASKLVGAQ